MPKWIGVEDYGYWQLYVFYAAYVGLAHLGWTDGIYLRYGGEKSESLRADQFAGQFLLLVGTQLILAAFLGGAGLVATGDYRVVLFFLASCLVLTNARSYSLQILQATGEIRASSRVISVGQIFYLALVIVSIVFAPGNYQLLMAADIAGRVVSLAVSLFFCRRILWGRLILDFHEICENLRFGSKVIFSYLSSLLIIGIPRFGIERVWSVEVFGKISLMLGIVRLLVTFLQSGSVVLFPYLRRISPLGLVENFMHLRNLITAVLLAMPLFSYPLGKLIELWLPSYVGAAKYFLYLFPVLIFEGSSIILMTYLKVLRMEGRLLSANIIATGASLFFTLIAVFVFEILDFAVMVVWISLAIRGGFLEYFVLSGLKAKNSPNPFWEVGGVVLFSGSLLMLQPPAVFLLYFIFFIFFTIFSRERMVNSFGWAYRGLKKN